MTKSKIEWTDRTWNPTVGCARVSPGCENCYAEKQAARIVLMGAAQGRDSVYLPVVDVERRRWNRTCVTVPGRLGDPPRWKKTAMIFVNSMSDLFHEDVPFEFIAAVFGVAAACPQHTFQILTKRPERAREFFAWLESEAASVGDTGGEVTPLMICVGYAQEYVNGLDCERWEWPLPNVWLGVSVEDQRRADERIPVLLECPAAVRFLSCEPLLGPVDLSRWIFDREAAIRRAMAGAAALNREQADAVIAEVGIGWAIVGGESGPGARECDADAIRRIVWQCRDADVPVFVKQLGARPVDVKAVTKIGPKVPHGNGWRRDADVSFTRAPLKLKSRKGADPNEWLVDLRVQQFPGGAK